MNLESLIAQYRSDSRDQVAPYLSSDEEVTIWMNEAQEEAALRANLLFEATDPDVCQIQVSAAAISYPLHDAIFQVTRATFTPTGSDPVDLALTDRTEQDRSHGGWRTRTDTPHHLIVDDTSVTLGCIPAADGVIDLECYRAPLEPMTKDGDAPEIGRAHHRFLPLWAQYRSCSRPDSELLDPEAAAKALAAFTRQFGERPDADLRRSLQANQPAHNQSYW